MKRFKPHRLGCIQQPQPYEAIDTRTAILKHVGTEPEDFFPEPLSTEDLHWLADNIYKLGFGVEPVVNGDGDFCCRWNVDDICCGIEFDLTEKIGEFWWFPIDDKTKAFDRVFNLSEDWSKLRASVIDQRLLPADPPLWGMFAKRYTDYFRESLEFAFSKASWGSHEDNGYKTMFADTPWGTIYISELDGCRETSIIRGFYWQHHYVEWNTNVDSRPIGGCIHYAPSGFNNLFGVALGTSPNFANNKMESIDYHKSYYWEKLAGLGLKL